MTEKQLKEREIRNNHKLTSYLIDLIDQMNASDIESLSIPICRGGKTFIIDVKKS